MASKRSYQSITLYKDMAPQILELEKVEAGEILQAIMRYSCYGEDTDMSQYDRFVRSLWKTIKLKLEAGETHDREISETNRNNAMKRWEKEKGNATACDGVQSNKLNATACDGTTYTYTYTVTGTNSSTTTISSTVTDTKQADAVSAGRLTASAAAENADPSAGDLFSFKQIKAMARRNKINLTDEGLQVFYEEMQDSGWILYQKPVEKKGIVKAVRGWAKNNPQYHLESVTEQADFQKNNPPKKVFKSFKPWLKYHGYDSNYENGFADYDEEITIDKEMMDIVWSVDNLSESMQSINERLADSGYGQEEIKPLMQLFLKWSKEKKEGR